MFLLEKTFFPPAPPPGVSSGTPERGALPRAPEIGDPPKKGQGVRGEFRRKNPPKSRQNRAKMGVFRGFWRPKVTFF